MSRPDYVLLQAYPFRFPLILSSTYKFTCHSCLLLLALTSPPSSSFLPPVLLLLWHQPPIDPDRYLTNMVARRPGGRVNVNSISTLSPPSTSTVSSRNLHVNPCGLHNSGRYVPFRFISSQSPTPHTTTSTSSTTISSSLLLLLLRRHHFSHIFVLLQQLLRSSPRVVGRYDQIMPHQEQNHFIRTHLGIFLLCDLFFCQDMQSTCPRRRRRRKKKKIKASWLPPQSRPSLWGVIQAQHLCIHHSIIYR